MPEEAERETRKRRIDHKLEAIGWKVIRYNESKPLSSYLSHAINNQSIEDEFDDLKLWIFIPL